MFWSSVENIVEKLVSFDSDQKVQKPEKSGNYDENNQGRHFNIQQYVLMFQIKNWVLQQKLITIN